MQDSIRTMLDGLPVHLGVGFPDLTARLTEGCHTTAQWLLEPDDG